MIDEVQGYTLRDWNNRIVYVGTSNNIRARRAEHLVDGKKFKSLKVETKPMSRKKAEAWEALRIKSHQAITGNRPRYNKTADGKGRSPASAKTTNTTRKRDTSAPSPTETPTKNGTHHRHSSNPVPLQPPKRGTSSVSM